MKYNIIFLFMALLFLTSKPSCAQESMMTYNKLTPEEERVIIHKGTEMPFLGKYDNSTEKGTYTCKRCNAPLYRSEDKFNSSCGWPSFDSEIPGAVKRVTDADGVRTEITCAACGAHLGHVFIGEGFTEKNVRHCVNSISMNFIPAQQETKTGTAYFAGGCFWGMEHFFRAAEGVISTSVGYMGGHTKNPTYKTVCSGTTGHAETIEVVFDTSQTTYETLAKLFFEIHDPTQVNRQGPDIGSQYRSAVFYLDDNQKRIAEDLVRKLENKGYRVTTAVSQAGPFWKAEDYHQDYYEKTGGDPYCHGFVKRF